MSAEAIQRFVDAARADLETALHRAGVTVNRYNEQGDPTTEDDFAVSWSYVTVDHETGRKTVLAYESQYDDPTVYYTCPGRLGDVIRAYSLLRNQRVGGESRVVHPDE